MEKENKHLTTIEYIDGENYSLEVDDKQFVELDQKEMKEICHRIIDNEQISGYTMQRLVEIFVSCDAKGEHEDLGNLVDRYKVII